MVLSAHIGGVAYHLPSGVLDNHQLERELRAWTADKIEAKTGIRERRVAAEGETAGDLAFIASEKLFGRFPSLRGMVDYVLLCTQSPDYFLPTTACLLQTRLSLPKECGALDFNLGCSGYVYGLGLAKGLIESGQARNILLLTSETYTKYINVQDKSVRTLFGDGAAATWIRAQDGSAPGLGPFAYGTDGSGAENLIVRSGGFRQERTSETAIEQVDEFKNVRSTNNLYMNGPEVFNFTIREVPPAIARQLHAESTTLEDYDLFVFHQANAYMLEHLRKKLGIPADKFIVAMEHCGNTVSATIPIALAESESQGILRAGMRVMLVGFGVGYSWATGSIRWNP